MSTVEDAYQARERIADVESLRFAYEIGHNTMIDQAFGKEIWFMLAGSGPAGSYKEGGITNAAIVAKESGALENKEGLAIMSSGNAALAGSIAAESLGIDTIAVMPATASPAKKRKIESHGVKVIDHDLETGEPITIRSREDIFAKITRGELAPRHALHAFNDERVMAGHGGWVGLQLVEGLQPNVKGLLVPVGGGGLLAGILPVIREKRPEIDIYAVEPADAADAGESFRTGQIVSLPEDKPSKSVADGIQTTALGDKTFPVIKKYMDPSRDRFEAVEDAYILQAQLIMETFLGASVEPTAAVAFAALIKDYDENGRENSKFPHNVAIVVTGSNYDPSQLEPYGRELEIAHGLGPAALREALRS